MKKSEKLLDALGAVETKYIEEYMQDEPAAARPSGRKLWRKWGALAAGLALVAAAAFAGVPRLAPGKPAEPNVIKNCVILQTLPQIKQQTVAIVVGTVEKTKTVKYNYPEDAIVSDGETGENALWIAFRVEEVWKGGLNAGDRIEIAESGDGETVIYQHILDFGGYLQKKDRVLLFLSYNEADRTAFEKANPGKKFPYTIWTQGTLWLDERGRIAEGKNPYAEWAQGCETLAQVRERIEEKK